MKLKIQIAATFVLVALQCPAARLRPPAEQAFATYVTNLEERLDRQHADPQAYLSVFDANPVGRAEVQRQLVAGAVRIDPVNAGSWEVPGALMHHWRAAAFVPRAIPEEMLALLRDANHLEQYYAPEIVSSHAVTVDGRRISLIRFKKRKVVTVVLDAEFESRSGFSGGGRGYSISRSAHVWQVDNPGTPREHRRPEGDDDGFLWRLNSYWSFAPAPNGLFIECEAVSLTRNIPLGLGWLIAPIVETLPRESLEFTLNATKNALIARVGQESRGDHAN